MRHGRRFWVLSAAATVVVLGMAWVSAAQPAAPAEKPARRAKAAPPTLDPAALDAGIAETSKWRLAEPLGMGKVEAVNGSPVLSVERAVYLITQTPVKADSEVVVRFRLLPDTGRPIALALDVGLPEGATPKDRNLFASVGAAKDATAVSCQFTDLNPPAGRRPVKNLSYRLGLTATRSLSWPEDIRKRIEADVASAEAVSDHWFTLRAVIRKHRVEFTIDGVPLAAIAKDGLQTEGFVRITAPVGAQVAQVSVADIAPESGLEVFEPVAIDSLLNADEVDGRRLDTASIGGSSREVELGGVPFVVPRPNHRGQDHVDVGASWVRQGNLEGRFSGDRDAFGGRWAGALERDPSRLQLRVPQGRYRALHLLAVADSDADSVPVLTAQFFRGGAGFPVSFESPAVPGLKGSSRKTESIDVKDENGKSVKLYRVTVPLDPGALAAFADQDYLDLELTKQVQTYRAYPDPLFYSVHGAGLPSGVRVFAATLERPNVDVDLQADAYAHVWTAPTKPTYTVKLRNRAGNARSVELTLTTTSYLDQQTTQQKQTVKIGAPGESAEATFKLDPPRFGHHDVKLTVKDGGQTWEETRTLAYLHEDTRERGDWAFGKGPLWGFYYWDGGHGTPRGDKQLLAMGLAGMETTTGTFADARTDDAEREVARRFKMRTYKFAGAGDHYVTLKFAGSLKDKGLDAAREEFLKTLNERKAAEDDLNLPLFLSYYAEPSIGHHTLVCPPELYGEPPLTWSEAEEERYTWFRNGLVEGGKIVRREFPHVKNMLPHGDPLFPLPFIARDAEARKLIDGVTVDIPCFERLPEQQMHQVSVHRMWVSNEAFKKHGMKPLYAMYEGPCIPTGPGALTQPELADLSVRNSLILLGYGVDLQTGGFPGFDCSAAWGEQHYGSGVLYRVPLEMPKPAYSAVATMTRVLNRANFDGWTPTGSNSVYALRFRHYKTGAITHVLWTIRGKRPVTIAAEAPGSAPTLIDPMDNATKLTPTDGKVTFTIDASPRYVTGLPAEIKIELGEPDHSDAQPAKIRQKLANLGDGSWKLSAEPDVEYEQSHYPHIARFPGKMSVNAVEAPADQGGKALAIHLDEQQEKQRFVMPYYTTLVPARPLVIDGKASHLGVWVKAASDWGRVVYFLTDAEGERWIGVGQRGAWNCDDLHSWTSFAFDGWRYLRFELPANAPYDSFRELGSTWWGAHSPGDRIIDLPLSVEKVVVERRTHVMHVNDPQPARADDVLLGDLFAEYASEADRGAEGIRLSKLRMPEPAGVPNLDNPIAKLEETGVGEPGKIDRITLPTQEADGTQCYVHFDKLPQAVTYDVWASPYPDGQGAIQLTKGWKEPGGLVRGFRPDTDFYLFLTYTDAEGKVSKPSEPFKINLKDLFGMK